MSDIAPSLEYLHAIAKAKGNPSPLNALTGECTKVALCGFPEKIRRQAPYDDPAWEIWGFNHAYKMGFMHDKEGRFRANRWFELHQFHAQPDDDMHWIKQCPVPIYLTQAFPENPMARAYPIESITSFFHFVCGRPPVFASSFAYAIALAIYLGFEEIGLYGCDLDWGRERAVEHGNLAFWAGLAMGRGVTITIPEKSAFLAHPARYGFDYDLEKAEIEKRCARLIFELLWNPAIAEQYEKYAYRWNHGGRDAVQSELWGSMEDLIVKQEAVG